MKVSQDLLDQHLLSLELGLTADQLLAQLSGHLTLSSIDGVLCLYDRQNPKSKLHVEFIHGALKYRSQQHLGAENLIKACQIKGQKQVTVLDGTCGLGTDSFLLSQAGFQVTAIEKNTIIYALLLDGMNRFQQQANELCFELVFGDVLNQFQSRTYDVIYLDPMFPNKVKSAKNKKTMQLFQLVHAVEIDNAAQLLEAALSTACQRVVIKRPKKAPLLTPFKPTFQVAGKTCRFDVYQIS